MLFKGLHTTMNENEGVTRIEDWSLENVVLVLDKWGLQEFIEIVKEKELNGRKLAVSIILTLKLFYYLFIIIFVYGDGNPGENGLSLEETRA